MTRASSVAEGLGLCGRLAERAIHVLGQPDHDGAYFFALDNVADLVKNPRVAMQSAIRMSKGSQFVGDRKTNPAISMINAEQAHLIEVAPEP